MKPYSLIICICSMMCLTWVIWISLSVLAIPGSRSEDEVMQWYDQVQRAFDRRHPSPGQILAAKGDGSTFTTLQTHNLHGRRCIAIESNVAIDYLHKDHYQMASKPVYIHTPCMGSDSLGNYLGSYFENFMCAKTIGLHYLSVAKIWEPSTNDTASVFLAQLPSYHIHAKPISSFKHISTSILNTCSCPGSCHQYKHALWAKNLEWIRPMLWKATYAHLGTLSGDANVTIVRDSDLATVAVGTQLPLIPDVAIHYRCGDNFVGEYGFLPFEAFLTRIPKAVKTIYVLAENRNRKTSAKVYLAEKCDAAFVGLKSYLAQHFPESNVVIRRGDDLYTDFARLALAPVTICSVSTYCLWPALMNKGKAYFPKTKLIVGGETDINLGFEWIISPTILRGKFYEATQPQEFVRLLQGGKVQAPAERVENMNKMVAGREPEDEASHNPKFPRMKRQSMRGGNGMGKNRVGGAAGGGGAGERRGMGKKLREKGAIAE